MPPHDAPANGGWSDLLSPREREVALLVNRGLSNKQIASELRLSSGTVKLHVHSIFLKLKAQMSFQSGTRKRYVLMQLMTDRSIAAPR
jgi:DNA-binding NarL/FixJ family response regulator